MPHPWCGTTLSIALLCSSAAGAVAAQPPADTGSTITTSAGLIAPAPASAEAHTATFDRPGVYIYVPDSGQAPIIDTAVNRAVARMFPLIRGIARQRLMRTNALPDTLRLVVAPDTLGVQIRREKAMLLPRSGATVRWEDGRGNVCRARDSVAADTLFQFCRVGTALSVARYVVGAEGRRLRMMVYVTSPHLSRPVEYSIEFAKHD